MPGFENPQDIFNIVKIFAIFAITFIVAMAWTSFFIKFLHKYHLGKQIREGNTPVYTSLHKKKAGTPTMGGLLIWVTVTVVIAIFWAISQLMPESIAASLNFLSRPQTYLPLGAMIISGVIGAIDDILNIKKIGPYGGGLRIRHRLLLYGLVAAGGAWWFYFKLGWDQINIPGFGEYVLGLWYIPLFIFVVVATSFSLNETDGLDGLAGGVALISFGSLALISFLTGKIELAMFCAAIIGGLLAFLWFNIYPARFFMGDTGSMSLGVTLGVIAMLTNSVFILPFLASVLVLESLSAIIQMISKKFRGKKIFLSSPLHHHLEAIGWPETNITMRFWIIAAVLAIVGLAIGLVGR